MKLTLIMWTIGEIAARDGVSKQAVSKTVKALIAARPDTPVERDMQGRVGKVSLAHYDHYRARHVNPAKASAPIRSDETTAVEDIRPSDSTASTLTAPPLDSFEEARRQREWLNVARDRIRHQEETGQLMRTDRVIDAVRRIGPELLAVLNRLPNRADDIAQALAQEGVHGVRMLLRKIATEIGMQMSDKVAEIAADAAMEDDGIEDPA